MTGISVRVDPEIDQSIPRNLGLAGPLGELRLDREDQLRRRPPPANSPRPAASVSSRPRPDARTVPGAQPGSSPIAHRHSDQRRIRHTNLRTTARHLHVFLILDGRLALVLGLDKRRRLSMPNLVL